MLGGALLSVIAFLILTLAVMEHRLDGVDHVARGFVHRPSHPVVQSSMEAASFLGGQPGQIAVVCLGSVVLWRRRRRWGLALPVIMAGAGILQATAKWAIDRPRPNLDPWGFPSAHVLSLVVLLGYVAYVLSTSTVPQWWRRLGVAGCAAIVCTVAYSRMYLDAHWPSDVLGGFSVGLAYLLLAIWMIGRSEADAHAGGRERPGADVEAIVPAVGVVVPLEVVAVEGVAAAQLEAHVA